MFRKFLLLVCLISVVSSSALAAPLNDLEIEKQAFEIFNSTMSPFCPGRLLRDCPSSQATELKNRVKSDLKSGKQPSEVVESLYKTFGDELRAAPKSSGFGGLAWAMPVVFVLVGLVLWFGWVRRSSAGAVTKDDFPAPESVAIDKALETRIRQEIEKS